MYSIIIGTLSLIIIAGLWSILKSFLSSSRNQNNAYLLGNDLNILNNKNNKNLLNAPTFAILGPQYSGKTTLFNLLTTNKITPFVTSQEISISNKNKNNIHRFTLIEFPGHIKLIYKWKTWLNLVTSNLNNNNTNNTSNTSGSGTRNSKNLKGIIFMIDSTHDFKSDKSNDYWEQVAEWLIYILEKLEQLNHPTNLLIACNKNESFISRPPNKIKSFLEMKIGQVLSRKKSNNSYKNNITTNTAIGTTTATAITTATNNNSNITRYNNISDEDGSNDNSLFDLFPDPLKFKFGSLETSVEVLGGSVLKQNIDPWKQWIEEHQ